MTQESKLLGTLLPSSPDFQPIIQRMRWKHNADLIEEVFVDGELASLPSFAVLCPGVPAMVDSKMLGHSRPSITLGISAHATLDLQDQAASVVDEIVTPDAVTMPKPEQVTRREATS